MGELLATPQEEKEFENYFHQELIVKRKESADFMLNNQLAFMEVDEDGEFQCQYRKKNGTGITAVGAGNTAIEAVLNLSFVNMLEE